MFHKKKLDDNTLRLIQDMFPDNDKIKSTIENFKNMNILNSSQNKIHRPYSAVHNKGSRTINPEEPKKSSNIDSTIPQHITKRKNDIPPNISEFYSQNNQLNNTDGYNANHNKINQHSTRSHKYEGSNSKINTIKNKVSEYKTQLNKQLLDLLTKEKRKEVMREKELENLDNNDPQKILLEKQYEEEREKVSKIILEKTKEIERKVNEYEIQLRNEN